jgi:hypothetical protein
VNEAAELDLMKAIHARWGSLLHSAAETSSIAESFLAALVANESGGNPNAKRFESHVLLALWEVLLGRKAAYGSIGRADVVAFVAAFTSGINTGTPYNTGAGAHFTDSLPSDAFQRVDGLATSWGLTQIMGYEAIAFHTNGVAALQSPVSELTITVKMLGQFAQHAGLDVAKDFPELFDCWNTGRPHSPTADPQYIPNGLARKALYESIAAASGGNGKDAAAPESAT